MKEPYSKHALIALDREAKRLQLAWIAGDQLLPELARAREFIYWRFAAGKQVSSACIQSCTNAVTLLIRRNRQAFDKAGAIAEKAANGSNNAMLMEHFANRVGNPHHSRHEAQKCLAFAEK
jgi:hypothetical protein